MEYLLIVTGTFHILSLWNRYYYHPTIYSLNFTNYLIAFFPPQIPSNYQCYFYPSIKVSYFLLFSYRHVQYSSLGKWNIFYHEILYFSKSRFIIAVWSFHLREFSVMQVKGLLFVLPSLAFLSTLLNKIKRCDKRRH